MKLLIIDDHEVVRKGLIATLAYEECFEIIEEATNVSEGIRKLRILLPDIVVVDLCLENNESGFEIIKKAQKEELHTKFIVLTASSRKSDFVEGKQLGVQGYILKDADLDEIVYAIRNVVKGKSFYSNEFEEIGNKTKQEQIKERLTEREYEVLRAVGRGLTNAQISQALFITEHTVKKHISSILGKLNLAHRTEVAILSSKLWRRTEDR